MPSLSPPTTPCLTEVEVRAFAAGQLGSDQGQSRLHLRLMHLDVCGACRERCAIAITALRSGAHRERDTQAETQPVVGAVVAGRYELRGLLGRGAMGLVYLALDLRLQREVALKVRRPRVGSDPNAQARRQEQEARALARLAHPNVLCVYDLGESDGQLYTAMELVRGGTLRDVLRASSHRSWRTRLALCLAAGRGLAAAHRAGLVHRDFKPENVLVGHDGAVKVSDFDLSRAVESSGHAALTGPGAVVGTLAYLAPELARGGGADARSDQYAFAVTAWELLCEDDAVTTPRWVRDALAISLRRQPSERHASMDALLSALERGLRVRAFARKALWSAAAVVVLCAGLSLVMPRPSAGCEEGSDPFAETWSAATRSRLERSFEEVSGVAGGETFRAVERAVERYITGWHADRSAACAAAGPAMMSRELHLTLACLDERRAELSALIGALRRPSAASIARAGEAVASLPATDRCARREGWRAHEVPKTQSAQERYQALRGELLEVKRAMLSGALARATSEAERLARLAGDAGSGTLEAEALWLQASSLRQRGVEDESNRVFGRAALVAEAAGDDELIARSLSGQLSIVFQRRDAKEARRIADRLGALARRTESPAVERKHRYAAALVLILEGAPSDAVREFRALREEGRFNWWRQDPEMETAALAGLVFALQESGAHTEALWTGWEAERLMRQRFGPQSVAALHQLHNQAVSLAWLGHLDAATVLFEHVLAGLDCGNPTDQRAPMIAKNLSYLLNLQGRYEEGLLQARQAELLASSRRAPDVVRALALLVQSEALLALGRNGEAARTASQAHGLLAARTHPYRFVAIYYLEVATWAPRGSRTLERRLRQLERQARSELGEGVELAELLRRRGVALLEAGASERAVSVLSEALEMMAKADLGSGYHMTQTQLALARALLGLGQRERAITLVKAVLRTLDTLPWADHQRREAEGLLQRVTRPRPGPRTAALGR